MGRIHVLQIFVNDGRFNDDLPIIITIAASTSLENLICRVADGVGVQLEPEGFAPIALEVFGSR